MNEMLKYDNSEFWVFNFLISSSCDFSLLLNINSLFSSFYWRRAIWLSFSMALSSRELCFFLCLSTSVNISPCLNDLISNPVSHDLIKGVLDYRICSWLLWTCGNYNHSIVQSSSSLPIVPVSCTTEYSFPVFQKY